MSRPSYRRGRAAILAAAGELGVREQVDAAGLRVLRQSGPWLFHQCPNYDDHARGDRRPSAQSNVESGHWQCFGCGASGRWPGFHGPAGGGPRPDDVAEIAPVEPFEPAPTRETRWDYTDELGNVVFWIRRGAGKEFRPRPSCRASSYRETTPTSAGRSRATSATSRFEPRATCGGPNYSPAWKSPLTVSLCVEATNTATRSKYDDVCWSSYHLYATASREPANRSAEPWG